MRYFLSFLLMFFLFLNTSSFAQIDIFGETYSDELPDEFKLSIETLSRQN